MTSELEQPPAQARRGIGAACEAFVRGLTLLLMYVSGAAILFMVGITTIDIVLRRLQIPFPGTYDLVQVAGAIAAACALPYTTAVKGHVAIELFYQKFGRRGRVITDSIMRPLSIAFFCLLTWMCGKYGVEMKGTGQVTPTLQLPMFWIPWMLAVSCGTVVLVKIYLLFHPGKVMIKP